MEKMLKRIIGDQVLLFVEPSSRPVKIEVDSSQLEQVVLNLVVNARDAMQGSGKIMVSVKTEKINDPRPCKGFSAQPGEYAVLTVSDEGQGMNEEILERIFEPYFTTKSEGKGTGLGLSMVYGIVKKSGGFITVETQVGKGTKFHIYFPLAASSREASGARADAQVNPKGCETILIVDDDPMTLEVVSSGLREYGYSILTANSATQGYALAQANPRGIQMLLTDVVMPGTNGYALAKMVKTLHPDIQVLFMSGYTDDDMLRSGVSEGRLNFIEKPFAPYQLAEKIRNILNSVSVNGMAAK
jgi:CheY-like chemotaxis protein